MLTSPAAVFSLGMLLLCLINSLAFRQTIGRWCKTSCRVLQSLIVEPIRWVLLSPLVQRIIHSRLFFLTFRFGVKPLIWTGIVWMFLPKENWRSTAGSMAPIFFAVNLFLNSRLGRNVEEASADWVVQSWHRFGLRLITGLFWWVIDWFKWLLQTIERLMYSVDEWLRFKSGASRATLTVKVGMGLVWFFIAYVLRFCVNVLIEPQINPIKHFPVVTVSHKLLLPLIPSLAYVLEITMDKPLAWTVAATTIWSIPGVFGFLVWELKENWRLYAANRKGILSPTPIGAHGETMTRLLKTGFHSGTLPKRYAKLRRAERRARAGGNWNSVRKQLHAIRGIETSLRRYVEREFLELFVQSKCWQAPAVTLELVQTGTNGVRLAIGCPGMAETTLRIALDVESGWLVAGITDPGWIDRLSPPQRQVLATALLGLYKTAGSDLVRQQIEDLFPPPMPWCNVTTEGLVLWPTDGEDVKVLYDFHEGEWIAPQSIRGFARRSLPTVRRSQLIFADVSISWNDWVMVWNQETVGQNEPFDSVAPVCVLPS